jgi:hypothetical protein
MSTLIFLSPYVTVICGHPFQGIDSNSVIIEGYMDPALEGTVVSFDCPPQQVLIGPNTTTCMRNGEWEPDPREVECKGIEGHAIILASFTYCMSIIWRAAGDEAMNIVSFLLFCRLKS